MKQTGIITAVICTLSAWFFWQQPTELEPREFSDTFASTPNALLIDLRSEREFAEGHIPDALNIDYNGPVFKWRIDELDTTAAVFLYCGSGIRSTNAAEYVLTKGFASLTLLRGGFISWQKEQLAQTPPEILPPPELTEKSFSRLLDLEHLVIVYFYVPWCGNCKGMGSALDELAIAYNGKVRVLRINTDRYKYLAAELGVEEGPVLQFYENGNLTGTLEGPVDRKAIEAQFLLKDYVNSPSTVKDGLSAR